MSYLVCFLNEQQSLAYDVTGGVSAVALCLLSTRGSSDHKELQKQPTSLFCAVAVVLQLFFDYSFLKFCFRIEAVQSWRSRFYDQDDSASPAHLPECQHTLISPVHVQFDRT